MNNTSVKEFYSLPENGEKKIELFLYILSIKEEYFNGRKIYNLELCDLEFKIKNVKIKDNAKGAKKGDALFIKSLNYIYGEEINIFIGDYDILENKYENIFNNKLEEYQNDAYIDCYFLFKEDKNKNELIGFNNEVINNDIMDIINNHKLKDSCVYQFKRLKKEKKFVKYVKNISYIKQSNGNILSERNLLLSEKEPFSFSGKIVKIEKNEVFVIASFINKIIVISNIGDKFNSFYENQYISIFYIRFDFEDEATICFKVTNFSIIQNYELLDINKIKSKVCIQFNLLDFENNNEEIQISKIGIVLPNSNIKELKLEKKIIYFIYEHNQDDVDYFPQPVVLFSLKTSFLYQIQFFVYKGFLNEANVFIRQSYYCAYEFLFFSIDDSLPSEIEILGKQNKKSKYYNFQNFNTKTRKKITFINIPPQRQQDLQFDNSFLEIKFCSVDGIKYYATFLISSLKIKTKSNYYYKTQIYQLLKDIYIDITKLVDAQYNNNELKKKYLSYNKEINETLTKELYEASSFNFKNDENTLHYFNNLCLWNVYNHLYKEFQ